MNAIIDYETALQCVEQRMIANIYHTALTEMGDLIRAMLEERVDTLYRDMPDGTTIQLDVLVEYQRYIFFTDLNQASNLQEAIDVIVRTEYDLTGNDQPDFIIQIIEKHANSVEDATRVADVMRCILGDIAICRDATIQYGSFKTLFDCICTYVEMFTDGDRYFYFRLAFMNKGFKRSVDCSTQLLRYLFILDPEYYHMTMEMDYNYEEIKKESKIQPYELMPFLCRPSFVQKWVSENGTNVEDYLN